MRWSVPIPQQAPDRFDDVAFRAYLTRAEELGFEAGWTMELLVGPAPVLAPMEVLAYAAACTHRMRLGVGVLVSSLHDPLQLAASATAVDRLSHGRLDLGVATGGGSRNFAAFGVDRETFVSRFVEGLELMKAAWSDEPRITFDGRFRQLENVAIEPKPVQRPHPPIWFGARAPKALARAVRHGDAFLGAGSATTAQFREQVPLLRREIERHDKQGFTIAKRVYVVVDDDRDRAREQVVTGLRGLYGSTPGITDVPVTGTPDDVVRGLQEVVDAGAESILVDPLVDGGIAGVHEQVERLAAEVLPRVG